MTIVDPLADMLSGIKNGQKAGKISILIPQSKLKYSVCMVLKNEGYIENYTSVEVENKYFIKIFLKYFNGIPVISELKRISKPGKRIYRNKNCIPLILGGLGVSIISNSFGVMTDKEAQKNGHGGEVLCTVS